MLSQHIHFDIYYKNETLYEYLILDDFDITEL